MTVITIAVATRRIDKSGAITFGEQGRCNPGEYSGNTESREAADSDYDEKCEKRETYARKHHTTVTVLFSIVHRAM